MNSFPHRLIFRAETQNASKTASKLFKDYTIISQMQNGQVQSFGYLDTDEDKEIYSDTRQLHENLKQTHIDAVQAFEQKMAAEYLLQKKSEPKKHPGSLHALRTTLRFLVRLPEPI